MRIVAQCPSTGDRVAVPVRWRNCAWKPRLVVRPGFGGFLWTKPVQPGGWRSNHGYRRLLKGARLRLVSRSLRRHRPDLKVWRRL